MKTMEILQVAPLFEMTMASLLLLVKSPARGAEVLASPFETLPLRLLPQPPVGEDEMLGAVRSRVKLWTIGAKSVAKGDHCRRLILRLILRMREPPLPHGHQAAVARVVVGACQERSRDSSHRHKRRPMLRAATMDAHEPHDHLLIARSLSLLQPSASFCFACCTCSKGNEHTP
jgi:hypothetical protein